MQILAKYSNLERLSDLQNSDIYIGWAQCISNKFRKMASAEAKMRLGKKRDSCLTRFRTIYGLWTAF